MIRVVDGKIRSKVAGERKLEIHSMKTKSEGELEDVQVLANLLTTRQLHSLWLVMLRVGI